MKRIQANEKNRFSTFVKSRTSEQYRDLEKWQKWFTERGIPSVIICTRSGYALYREGLTEIDIHDEGSSAVYAESQPKSFFGSAGGATPAGTPPAEYKPEYTPSDQNRSTWHV